jgi:hypothetical protein
MPEYAVTIAGRTSTLRYPFPTRMEIEKRLEKGLFEACFSGLIEDQIVILWAGLKHDTKGNKGLTPEILAKQLEAHVEATNEPVNEIVLTAIRAVLNAKLIKVNEKQVNLLLDEMSTEGDGAAAVSGGEGKE